MRRVGSYWEFACSKCHYVVQTTGKPTDPVCPACLQQEHLEQAAGHGMAVRADRARLERELEEARRLISRLEDEVAELRQGAA